MPLRLDREARLQTMIMFNNKIRGQATAELAILGSIILLILGAMLRYGQTISASQKMQMYAFEKAVKFAKGRAAQGSHMGRVSFNAVEDIYPVDVTGFHAQGTNVSGSATVLYDPEMSFYDGTDREDYGKSYTQAGREMMARNEVIEFPQINVTRKNDSKGSSAWWERIMDTMFGSDAPSEVEVWEQAPVESAQQVAGPQGMDLEKDWGGVTAIDDLYNYQPVETASTTRTENSSGIGGAKKTTRQQQNMQKYFFKSEDKMKQDDPDVISVSEKPQGDLAIITEETVSKERQWQTPQ